CGEQNKDKGQPVNRIRYWEGLADHYQIPIESDEKNTCWQQTPYGSLNLNGATDVLYTNWDGNWKYYSDRPGGYSFECELVGFQTAYSALVAGDYEKCVTNFYGSHSSWPQVRVVDAIDPGTPPEPPVDGIVGWEATKVYNTGDKVSYKGATYEAKWWSQGNEPTQGDPWKLITGEPTAPTTPDPVEPPPVVNEPEPPVTSEPTPPSSDFSSWVAGVTVAKNGDKITHNGKCFMAKNNPGVWESPTQSNWFWDEINCQ
ncbi:carbohydrate-binding protein, partial [Vibrio sp. V17_P4S1T151]